MWMYLPTPPHRQDMTQGQLAIDIMVRVFTNGPGDYGSIPGRVIPKTQKMILDATLLNIQHYKVHIKGKVEQSRKRSSASPTPWCSSYWKGSLLVALNYSRQLYLLLTHLNLEFSFSKIGCLTKAKEAFSTLLFHSFPKRIDTMWNTNSFVYDFNSGPCLPFPMTITIIYPFIIVIINYISIYYLNTDFKSSHCVYFLWQ